MTALPGIRIGMHRSHSWLLVLFCLLAATFPLGGCLFRTRVIERQLSNAPLKTATQKELIDYVNTQAGRIESMQATVDIDSTAGDPRSEEHTSELQSLRHLVCRLLL